MKLVQITFPYPGPFGDGMAEAYAGLAESINDEPGMIWKIWTESEELGCAGGIYLFESEETAQAYLCKHMGRLGSFGIEHVDAKLLDPNPALSRITHGPIGG